MPRKPKIFSGKKPSVPPPDEAEPPPRPKTPPHTAIWGWTFFPEHARVEPPAFHYSLIDHLDSPLRQVCAVCPRGHGKSTVTTLLWLLHEIAYNKVKFILVVADTRDQAALYLDDIRRECESNEALLAGFPGLAQGDIWTRTDLLFANGARVQALGAGQKVRGRKHNGRRPDLILLDDAENDDAVATKERRDKLRRWLYAAVIPALGPKGRIRVVGTILHRDSLLSKLMGDPSWDAKMWTALDEQENALWPEWKPSSVLTQDREDHRLAGLIDVWYQEYQGVSRSPGNAAFKETDFRYFDRLPRTSEGDKLQFWKSLYVDPAISKGEKADFTAYTVVYASHDGHWYVVESFRRRHDPSELCSTIEMLHERHQFNVVGIEGVAYQRALTHWLNERYETGKASIPVETVTPDGDKRRRILGLQPFFRAGRIILRRGLGGRLEEELLHLDDCDHDDVADSLAGHLEITIRPEPPRLRQKRYADAATERAAKHRKSIARKARLRKRGIDTDLLAA